MSYLTFLLIFVVVPIALLGWIAPRPLCGVGSRRGMLALALTSLLALIYTTPWDNYLVYRGVWTYGAERVLGVIGYVPIEEYAFFLLQPFLTGLVMCHTLERWGQLKTSNRAAQVGGAIIYGLLTLTGILLLVVSIDEGLYLGLILAWAGPILLTMWIYAGGYIWQLRSAAIPAVLISTVYLWTADRFAIGAGIWDIADAWSFDFEPLGLPVEEAVFFLLTNLLVVQSVILFLHGDRIHAYRTTSASNPRS